MAKTLKRTRTRGSAKSGSKSGPRLAKQQYLDEDMAPVTIEDIENQGAKFIEAKDERKRYLEQAKAAQQALIELMMKHKITEYTLEIDTRTFKLELQDETRLKTSKLKLLVEEAA